MCLPLSYSFTKLGVVFLLFVEFCRIIALVLPVTVGGLPLVFSFLRRGSFFLPLTLLRDGLPQWFHIPT